MKDEANIFQKMMSLAIKNDSLEKELRLTKDLISKGVLDSHSYILGFNDGKQSSRDEIEALKSEIVSIEKNTDYWADKANWIKNNEPVAYVSTTGLNDIEWTDASHSLNYGDALYTHPAKELTMTFEEMYPIAEKHLGHAIGLYNWKIFGDAILRKAQEK